MEQLIGEQQVLSRLPHNLPVSRFQFKDQTFESLPATESPVLIKILKYLRIYLIVWDK